MRDEIAIVMAAGLGTRMQPITNTIAKPLVKVHGTPMIETVISGLISRDVEHIYIVVGYKKEQFEYLTKHYNNITLIESFEYKDKNNISSLKAVGDILGSKNCFICEADLWIQDKKIFEGEFEKSCYFGKMVEGYSDDWVFKQKDNRIVNVRKGGQDLYNMVGVSYWLKEDALVLYNSILESYKTIGHEKLFWDDIVDKEINNIYVTVCPVNEEQIIEIDTCEELAKIDSFYNRVIELS